jgi:uncharacterized protein YqgQ
MINIYYLSEISYLYHSHIFYYLAWTNSALIIKTNKITSIKHNTNLLTFNSQFKNI